MLFLVHHVLEKYIILALLALLFENAGVITDLSLSLGCLLRVLLLNFMELHAWGFTLRRSLQWFRLEVVRSA